LLSIIGIAVLLFSIIVHEVSHGQMAYWKGDPTAKNEGRITLNPIPHIDPIGSILLPAILLITHSPFFIGWAKPVPFNPYLLRNPNKDSMFVALAGPASNLSLMILFTILGLGGAAIGIPIIKVDAYSIGGANAFGELIFQGVLINLILASFNLIPIPPLDGSHILSYFLPFKARENYERIRPFGFFILILLIMSPIWRYVLTPFLSIADILFRLIMLVQAH
jgi:Zn-dependent protease